MLAVALTMALVPVAPAAASNDPAAETALLSLLDGERGARGLPALRVCDDLRAVAQRWTERLTGEHRLSHNAALRHEVRGWRSLGENVGYDASPEGVHARYMASDRHRGHLLSPVFSEIGVGAVWTDGRLWVTQVFREPDGSAPCAPVGPGDIATACPHARVPEPGFTDTRGNPHRHAIACVVWYGIANGASGGQYSPSLAVTRAQMATFLARVMAVSGAALPEPHDQGFADIAGSPHADAINRLAALGIVQGTSATSYGPQRTVTRAQTAALLVRTAEHITGRALPASRDWFRDDNGSTHEHAINRAAEASFLRGLAPGVFGPQRTMRRDQTASSVARLLDDLVARGHLHPPA